MVRRAAGSAEGQSFDVLLGRGSARRPVPMELRVGRWSTASDTALDLQPRRDVRPSARYFAEGHGLLDALEALLLR